VQAVAYHPGGEQVSTAGWDGVVRRWRATDGSEITPPLIHDAAMSNLATWSSGADWVDETDAHRRVVWSDSEEGLDATRILLAEVREHLVSDLALAGRILIGLPERDLLIAAGVAEGDDEFVSMFADYVADRAGAADEPIDDRVFELVDGELIPLEASFEA